MYTMLAFPDDTFAQEQGVILDKELLATGEANQLPAWGKIWVRGGKVICTMPVHPFDEFCAPPLLFVDETLEFKQSLFFVGALAFKPVMAILAVARHIQNLVVIAQAHEGFWPSDSSPPRLHLRELTNPEAKAKTRWKYVPPQHIEMLFKTFVPMLKQLSGLKLIAPVHLNKLGTALKKTLPEGETQARQMALQMAALMLRSMLAGANLVDGRLEIVADHDHTPLSLGVGKSRRQATLHLLDALVGTHANVPLKQELFWNKDARYSSKFPADFSLDALETRGYSLRTLVEPVGLQFVDAYLGLWRIINRNKRPCFGVESDDLGVQTITNMHWAP